MSSALFVAPDGRVIGIHTDSIELGDLGKLNVSRATTIEYDNAAQKWVVRDIEGNFLYSHASRSKCLAWEVEWLDRVLVEQHGGIADE